MCGHPANDLFLTMRDIAQAEGVGSLFAGATVGIVGLRGVARWS